VPLRRLGRRIFLQRYRRSPEEPPSIALADRWRAFRPARFRSNCRNLWRTPASALQTPDRRTGDFPSPSKGFAPDRCAGKRTLRSARSIVVAFIAAGARRGSRAFGFRRHRDHFDLAHGRAWASPLPSIGKSNVNWNGGRGVVMRFPSYLPSLQPLAGPFGPSGHRGGLLRRSPTSAPRSERLAAPSVHRVTLEHGVDFPG
jgi:hypothetical protein